MAWLFAKSSRVGNIERRRASKELDLAFSFEAAEGRWTAWAQASAKLLKSPSKTIRIDGSLGSPAWGQRAIEDIAAS
jgi:hypothetical protein